MKIIVSGLINIETTLKVRKFPIEYYPIDYPFFGINSDISGVAYNVAKALLTLGNKVQLTSFIGEDEEGRRILARLKEDGIGNQFIYPELKETPVTIALYDGESKRQIYCDLKEFPALKIRCNGAARGFCSEETVEEYYKNNELTVREANRYAEKKLS